MSHPYLASFLDNDLYKFTMMQASFEVAGLKEATYEFKCRTSGIDWRPYHKPISEAIYSMDSVRITEDELSYLKGLDLFTPLYLDSLRNFSFNPIAHISVYCDTERQLRIRIHGPWYLTILYEVPILSIVNQVYADSINPSDIKAEDHLSHYADDYVLPGDFRFADFGTRRRRSFKWQEHVNNKFKACRSFIGTSNVHLAKNQGTRPVGTMAHEWIMAGQVLAPSLVESQVFMLHSWANTYRGKLGIALSDTLGSKAFIRDFDGYFARLYDGVRQDSGDPEAFAETIISHYKSLGINPKHKTLVFSDGLDIPKALDLWNHFGDSINSVFGIGTKLTNDFTYPNGAPNIVIKLTELCGKPVAKLSDSPGKGMCNDESYLQKLKEEVGAH